MAGKAENARFRSVRRPGEKGLVGVDGDAVCVNDFLRHIIHAVVAVGGNNASLVPASYDPAHRVIAVSYVLAVRIGNFRYPARSTLVVGIFAEDFSVNSTKVCVWIAVWVRRG